MESGKTAARRRYSPELKAQIMAECETPGASVAKVAMAHGVNANVVHSWRKRRREEADPQPHVLGSEFVPLSFPVPPMATRPMESIQLELRRGGVSLTVSWPLSGAAELARWTREVLQ